MNFAIVGKGFIYPRHEQAIQKVGSKVLMTCDIDLATKPDFTDWVEMFNHPSFEEVDAVSICTPNHLHSVIAREAQLRGKKVLCEKPLSINGTDRMGRTMTVLQLRHHPELYRLRPANIEVEAKMYRDDSYWKGWKGNPVKSGGILFNLGIHYIDLMIFLLGKPTKVVSAEVSDKLAKGEVKFGKFTGKFHIEIVDSRARQGRKLTIGGKEINLSNKDNLSYEDLHTQVYSDFVNGGGIGLQKAKKSLELVNQLLSWKK